MDKQTTSQIGTQTVATVRTIFIVLLVYLFYANLSLRHIKHLKCFAKLDRFITCLLAWSSVGRLRLFLIFQ